MTLSASPASAARPRVTSTSPDRLRRLVRALASEPGAWASRVRYELDRRWYTLLEQDEDREIWLLSWLPGQQTGFHDHGGSAGAFAVASGRLEERAVRRGRPQLRGSALGTGAARAFGPGYVHNVLNVSGHPAVSVHAYSPPLAEMNRFEITSSGLLAPAPGNVPTTWRGTD